MRTDVNLWEPYEGQEALQEIAMPELLTNGVLFEAMCSPSSFLQAPREFSWRTSSSYDGFHPRHYSLLQNRGAAIVAQIWGASSWRWAPCQTNVVPLSLPCSPSPPVASGLWGSSRHSTES